MGVSSASSLPDVNVTSLTDAELAEARSELGTTIDVPDLVARYNRLDSFAAAINETLEERLATLLASPAKFGVEGYNQDTSKNIDALREQLTRRTGSGVSGVSVVRIVPPPPMRRR